MKFSLRNHGFSLIEVLVGLAIGMIGMLVMMQVFTVTETGKRSASGSDDAQTAGGIAMYSIQRDIRQAGYGISTIRLIGCDVTLPGGRVLTSMAPVTINHAAIPAGDPNTDTILVIGGNGNGSTDGDTITSQPAINTYSVTAVSSFRVGNQVIVSPPRPLITAPCALRMEPITGTPVGTNNIVVNGGVAGVAGGYAYNMGSAPYATVYAVRNSVLTSCNLMVNDCTLPSNVNDALIWPALASNVVSLRAVYGRDTTVAPATPTGMDAIVDVYDQNTPIAPNRACGFSRIFSVRLALVARNASYSKEVLSTAAPDWMESVATPILLENEDEWQHYRYKVFQTEVPIRNVVASGVVPSLTSGGLTPCLLN